MEFLMERPCLRGSKCLIGQEKHQDGNLHLHVVLQRDDPIILSLPDALDFLEGARYHPNIQACRNLPKALKYVTKEDSDPHVEPADWDWQTLIGNQDSHRSPTRDLVATMLESGSTLNAVKEVAPGFLMMNLERVQAYQMWLKAQVKPLSPWTPPLVHTNSLENEVGAWLTANIQKDRTPRQRNLWLHGTSNTGKTHLCLQLREMLDIYWFPMSEDFHNLFDNSKDLIVMDEFVGHLPIQSMNLWCSGTPMQVRTKGGQLHKDIHIPVIVTSNEPPDHFYQNIQLKHPLTFQAFLTRFHVVHVTHQLNIKFN